MFKISKRKTIFTLIVAAVVIGLAIPASIAVINWTNQVVVKFRSPVQIPWVITKRADEARKVKTLEETVEMLMGQVNEQGEWISKVDPTLPDIAKKDSRPQK